MSDDTLQKLPPQNLEAEQAVLGAVLIDENALGEIVALLRVEDFYKDAHRKIYESMIFLAGRQEAIDLVTLPDALKRNNVSLEGVGGVSYLSYLVTLVPTAANIKNHAQMVVRAAQLRGALRYCTDAITKAYNNQDPDEVITELVSKLNDTRRHEGPAIVTQKEFIQCGFNSIEQRSIAAKDGKIIGLPTGLRELDRVTCGLQPDYYLIAGRPSMGKTALAECIRDAVAEHFLREWGQLEIDARPDKPQKSVGFISIEMGKEQLALRAISRKSKVPLSRIYAGTLHPQDWGPMSNSAGELFPLPIFYEFESASDVLVGKKIDELVQKHGARIIFVDYLQLMKSHEAHGNREQEISSISRMVKHKNKQHGIPIIALAQLNRALEARTDKRPMLADLRESGSLEQDADVIMFVYREEIYKKCECDEEGECFCKRRGKAQLLGRKGRMIGTWEIDLKWNGNLTKFSDAD